MRTLSLSAAALAVLLTAACESPSAGVDGRLTGSLRGEPWSGSAELRSGPADGSMLYSQMRRSGGTSVIGLDVAAHAPGTYPIREGSGWYETRPDNGDAYTATATGGTLVVASVTGTELRGTLELTFRGLGGETFSLIGGEYVARPARTPWSR